MLVLKWEQHRLFSFLPEHDVNSDEVKPMTKFEQENWICNLQNAAAAVAAHLGEETVKHVLVKYGADSIEGLE